ncbi:MAG: TIGR04053 family radical SAM/SPASM domain-containing protein [Fimbriimonas sp.]|nr:TIGR04053 family radical SAM/SPASM domain-containing protein [Fimbriimonas sp.]
MTHATRIDFAQRPMLVYWETTQACPLACKHCRASAMPHAHPDQLSFDEGLRLLDGIASFGDPLPHLVLTGGDPLHRDRLFDLIAEARARGIRVSITPAASPFLTKQVFEELKAAGVESLALSLDGSNATRHDDIRQVPGCFDITIQAAKWAGEVGLPLQVNTLVSEETVDDLDNVYQLLHGFPVMRWSLFFLIAVGRGKQLNEVDPIGGEKIMHWVQRLVPVSPFQIKTTEAPSYRRVASEAMKEQGMTADQIRSTSVHAGYGIRDGNGIVFISHTGKVYPSGFLPLEAGDVRFTPLQEIYQSSEVFRTVRDVDGFDGKCGHCEYRRICGGSRARAFAHTGNPAGSDPLCDYEPVAHMAIA